MDSGWPPGRAGPPGRPATVSPRRCGAWRASLAGTVAALVSLARGGGGVRWSRRTGRQGALRKVRAPQGRLPGNAWAPQGDGSGHRKQTALYPRVRVKRWGKSPPRAWRQARHGNPQSEQGQVSSETRPGSFELRVGRVEVAGDSHPREMTICSPVG